MRRRWKAVVLVLCALAVLLGVNAMVTDSQTKQAGVTIEGGRILPLTGRDVQVFQEGPRRGQPIILLHCFPCSLHWWDAVASRLAQEHRVIRMDLLGFGGSEKPKSGYGIEEQASLVAEAMGRLGAQGAVVVGHSMGFDVATALVQSHSELVDRLVNIGEVSDPDFGDPPFLMRFTLLPVIGEALWRVTPDFVVKDGYDVAFAPGFDIDTGFEDPDQVVQDWNAMTYTSYDSTDTDAFEEEQPLDDRVRAAAVPLLVIFGAEDQTTDDPAEAAEAYADVPGAEIHLIDGAGHSPNVEEPAETAGLIAHFAARSHYEPPRRVRLGAPQVDQDERKRNRKRDQDRRRPHRQGQNDRRG